MNIVVRGANWIGDAVMSVPALRALRRLFPSDRITLHTRSWATGIFRNADFIDEILVFDKPESSLKEVVDQSRALREREFEMALLLPNSFASALTARFAGIPKRFGYSRDARRIFLTDPVPVPAWKNEKHQVFYYLNLISAVENALLGTDSVAELEPDASLPVSKARRAEARELLESNGVDLKRRSVGLGVGSANSNAKRWPAARYAELTDRLQREVGANVILMGSPDELEVSHDVYSKCRIKPIVLTGMTDIDAATAVLSELDLVVSNDMGLAHISASVGTSTKVIFGPTDPLVTRPFGPRAEVIREPVECSPCMLRVCPIDHRCMTRISVDRVFSIASAELAGNPHI
jgi:heptosyltransferase-2